MSIISSFCALHTATDTVFISKTYPTQLALYHVKTKAADVFYSALIPYTVSFYGVRREITQNNFFCKKVRDIEGKKYSL